MTGTYFAIALIKWHGVPRSLVKVQELEHTIVICTPPHLKVILLGFGVTFFNPRVNSIKCACLMAT